jgi:hypothetical protein
LKTVEELRVSHSETEGGDERSMVWNTIGFNLVALKLMRREIDEQNDVKLFADAREKNQQRDRDKETRGVWVWVGGC